MGLKIGRCQFNPTVNVNKAIAPIMTKVMSWDCPDSPFSTITFVRFFHIIKAAIAQIIKTPNPIIP